MKVYTIQGNHGRSSTAAVNITITVVRNFTHDNGILDPSAPTAPRPYRRTPRNPMGIYAEPSGNCVSGGSTPTGSMLCPGPGEEADGANNNRRGRQPSVGDEAPGNPDAESKDSSASATNEAAAPQGDEGEKEGFEEGFEKGEKKGRMESAREMVIDTIFDLFGNPSGDMIDKIKSISHLEILKGINRKALKCKNIEQFQDILNGVA